MKPGNDGGNVIQLDSWNHNSLSSNSIGHLRRTSCPAGRLSGWSSSFGPLRHLRYRWPSARGVLPATTVLSLEGKQTTLLINQPMGIWDINASNYRVFVLFFLSGILIKFTGGYIFDVMSCDFLGDMMVRPWRQFPSFHGPKLSMIYPLNTVIFHCPKLTKWEESCQQIEFLTGVHLTQKEVNGYDSWHQVGITLKENHDLQLHGGKWKRIFYFAGLYSVCHVVWNISSLKNSATPEKWPGERARSWSLTRAHLLLNFGRAHAARDVWKYHDCPIKSPSLCPLVNVYITIEHLHF